MNQGQPQLSGVFRHTLTVPPDAIDQNGHASNVVFVQWMQDAAVQHFAAAGGVEPMRAVGGGWVVRSHRIEYLSPAFVADQLEVATWIVDFQRVRSLRCYRFLRRSDARLLARGETDWVFVNVASGRPCSIPATIRQAFTLVASDHVP